MELNSTRFYVGMGINGNHRRFKSLGILITLLGLLKLLGGCVSSEPSQLSSRSLEKIATENTELSSSKLDLKIRPLWTKDEKKVLWIDFNHPDLCGMNHHCLYAIYHQYGESVSLAWRSYLDPRLPPKFNLIESKNPCLILNQVEDSKLNQYELCPVGDNQYDITNQKTVNLN